MTLRYSWIILLCLNLSVHSQDITGSWFIEVPNDSSIPLFSDTSITLKRGTPQGNGCFFILTISEDEDSLTLSSSGYCQDSRCGWSYDHRYRIVANRKRNKLVGTLEWFNERWQSQSFQDIRIRYRLDQGILKIRRVRIE